MTVCTTLTVCKILLWRWKVTFPMIKYYNFPNALFIVTRLRLLVAANIKIYRQALLRCAQCPNFLAAGDAERQRLEHAAPVGVTASSILNFQISQTEKKLFRTKWQKTHELILQEKSTKIFLKALHNFSPLLIILDEGSRWKDTDRKTKTIFFEDFFQFLWMTRK